ncbi:MAG: hypothetical protein CSA97_04880 [Bacteroidetes bacterium]|nr:MAG: hypothetical protein CSA97_04880 [Bacteroidota bacterium]
MDIPGSVTSIGRVAFVDCGSLEIVYVSTASPPHCSGFLGVNSTAKIYVPLGSKDEYVKDYDWYLCAGQIEEKEVHTVSFNMDGGELGGKKQLDPVLIFVGSGLSVLDPGKPTKDGHRFVEWQLNGAKYDFKTAVAEDITLVAKWIPTYTVSFNTNGGNETISPATVDWNTQVSAPKNPTKHGHRFVEWRWNGEKYDFGSAVTKDITLVAKWQIYTYTVTFDAQGGIGSVASVEVDWNTQVGEPKALAKEGYRFVEWQLSGAKYDFKTAVKKDITLVAKWIPTCSVSFNTNGGKETIAQATVDKDAQVVEPTAPTKDGYKFVEWQLNGVKYDFGSAVTKDITLVAKWEKKNEGSSPNGSSTGGSSQGKKPGSSQNNPQNPNPVSKASAVSLSISPNPATDFVRIEGLEAGVLVHIYTLGGGLVRSERLSPESQLDVRSLPAGVYLLEVKGQTLRLVKE